MTFSTVNNYKNLVQEIPNLIGVSGYKTEYIARKLDMKPQSFSVKKLRKTFNIEQIDKILNVIFNDDVEDYLLILEMRGRKNEETFTLAEYKKEIATWK